MCKERDKLGSHDDILFVTNHVEGLFRNISYRSLGPLVMMMSRSHNYKVRRIKLRSLV